MKLYSDTKVGLCQEIGRSCPSRTSTQEKGRNTEAEGDVALWDEEEVRQWVRQISSANRDAVLHECTSPSTIVREQRIGGVQKGGHQSLQYRAFMTVKGDILDHLVALFLHHNINGNRLLDITLKDLECLDICSLGLRSNIFREIKTLRQESHRMKNFPSLQVLQQLDHKKDGDMPADLFNSHVLIKSVCMSILSDDKSIVREPYRCASYPYAVSEWIDSPTNGGEVEVVCALSYTDRVIRPRNTCKRAKLFDFSRAQILDNKRGVGMSSTFQGIWRSRASASTLMPPDLSDDSSSIISTPKSVAKSPMWANIAAGIFSGQSPSSASTNDSFALSPNACENVSCRKDVTALDVSQSPLRWPKSVVNGNAILCTQNLFRDSILVNPLPRMPGDVRPQRLYRTQSRQQMESRKLSGTMARMRRRPLPIILSRRIFRKMKHSIQRQISGNDEMRLVVSEYKDGEVKECGTNENGQEDAWKSRRRRRHRPHKRGAKKGHSEQRWGGESLPTNVSNCILNKTEPRQRERPSTVDTRSGTRSE